MTDCLICQAEVKSFLDLGKVPSANAYVAPEQFADEYFYRLEIGFCEKCYMVQLLNRVQPEHMFHENYAYFSSTSQGMIKHFKQFANDLLQHYLTADDAFVVEIGCNDGIMLRHFHAEKVSYLGVEPSTNVAQAALDQGLNVLTSFFNQTTAQAILQQQGPADVICGANVLGHIEDLHSVFKGLDVLLKPTGVAVFEHPYLVDLLENVAYDQFYDEHVYYFSLLSLNHLAHCYGLELIDALPQSTHGGTLRYVLARQGQYPISASLREQLAKEQQMGLDKLAHYQQFAERVAASRTALVGLLQQLRAEGKRVVGYGATAKSSTVLNYCEIGPELIEFISDVTPTKQGKYSPGMHIPIRPYTAFTEDYPDYAVLFAWNHAKEIMAKESAFTEGGGKWIVYVPEVTVF